MAGRPGSKGRIYPASTCIWEAGTIPEVGKQYPTGIVVSRGLARKCKRTFFDWLFRRPEYWACLVFFDRPQPMTKQEWKKRVNRGEELQACSQCGLGLPCECPSPAPRWGRRSGGIRMDMWG